MFAPLPKTTLAIAKPPHPPRVLPVHAPKLTSIHIHPAANGFTATHHFGSGPNAIKATKSFVFKNPGALQAMSNHVAHTAKSVWLGNKTGTRVPMFSRMRRHAQELDTTGYS